MTKHVSLFSAVILAIAAVVLAFGAGYLAADRAVTDSDVLVGHIEAASAQRRQVQVIELNSQVLDRLGPQSESGQLASERITQATAHLTQLSITLAEAAAASNWEWEPAVGDAVTRYAESAQRVITALPPDGAAAGPELAAALEEVHAQHPTLIDLLDETHRRIGEVQRETLRQGVAVQRMSLIGLALTSLIAIGAIALIARRWRHDRDELLTISQELRRSEGRFGIVIEAIAEGLIVLDDRGQLVTMNRAAYELLRVNYESEPYVRFFDEDGLEIPEEQWPAARALRTGRPVLQELVTTVVDGETRWLLLSAVPISDDKGQLTVSTIVDVTSRRLIERALERSENRFRVAMESAPFGMALVALDGTIWEVNTAFASLVGQAPHELQTQQLAGITHPADVASDRDQIAEIRAGIRNEYTVEKRLVRVDGAVIWVQMAVAAVREDGHDANHLVVQVQDITQQRRQAELLAHRALHDPLTGLANRALLMEELGTMLRDARNAERQVAVLFCDLDNFKIVNDSLGHDAGDQVLLFVAEALQAATRRSDIVARLGGDEFVVVLAEVGGEADAVTVAAELSAAVSTRLRVGSHWVTPQMSIGIVVSNDHLDPSLLLRDADTALYRAKEAGKSRWEVFDPSMRSKAVERLEMEHELARALESDELRLYYQPVVDLRTGETSGYEGLLRWEHPERGLIMPEEFIPVAEECGLINRIGKLVLEEGAGFLARRRESSRYLSVNVSPRQLGVADLTGTITNILNEHDLQPGRLVIELTESSLVHTAPASQADLARLYEAGIAIVLDDFGTGFSPLSYVRDLPVSGLKLDRTFTAGLPENPAAVRISRALAALVRELDLVSVAEGIETREQADFLRGQGWMLGQGHLFGKAVPEADLEI